MSLFTSAPSSISIKLQTQLIKDPILYKNFSSLDTSKVIWFVFEKPYSDNYLKSFKSFLKNKFPNLRYAFVSSLLVTPSEKDLKNSKVKFYKNNRAPLEKIIPPFSKVISIGRAIYAITQTDDLYPEDFIDEVTFKNSFYSPDLKSEVFPILYLDQWLKEDNFFRLHCIAQIEKCIDYKVDKHRVRKLNHNLISNPSSFFEKHQEEQLMSLDIETNGVNWRTGKIKDLTIAFNRYEGYHLFWKDINVKELSNFLKGKKLIMQNGKFDSKFLIRKGVSKNSIYIIDTWNMLHIWKEDNSHNSLKSGTWRLTKYGGYDRPLDEYKEKYKVKSYIDDIPDDIRIPYAIEDAIHTFEIYEELLKIFKYMDKKYPLNNGWGVERYFNEIVTPAVNTFLDVELRGLDINYEELKNVSKELKIEIEKIEEKVYKAFNKSKKDFNIYSTDQLSNLIENELKWKVEERGKKGIALTNEACLLRWKEQGHKEAELLLKLREKEALMKTFVGEEHLNNGYFQYIVKEGEKYKIYPTIFPMLAQSHRSKHINPNTANIPSHGENAFFIRRMFQPPSEDYVFLSADASGLQLRLGAIVSGDEAMRDIFINKGGDMHSLTASVVFGNLISYKKSINGEVEIIKGKKEGYKSLKFEDFVRLKKINEVVKNYRFKAKAVNFSAEFGARSTTIKIQSIDPEWTEETCDDYIRYNNLKDIQNKHYASYKDKGYKEEEAKFHSKSLTVAEDIRKKFFEKYYGLAYWIETTREKASKQGFVQSIYGAIRRLPYLLYQGQDSDHRHIANLLNICLNSSIQNMESVIMNRWMTKVHKFIKENNMKSYFIGQIHDAVEMIVYKPELKNIYNFMKEEFEKSYIEYNGIPLELEANVADYWKTYKTDNWEVWDMGKDLEGYIN